MSIIFTNWNDYIPYVGQSWGAAWGNVVSGVTPELWTVNHQAFATLFQSSATIAQNITNETFGSNIRGDLHGSAWADFDNDGDQDLIQQVASDFGGSVTQFYVNANGQLSDQAEQRGINEPLKGRTPLWLDYNRDGKLDLILSGPTGNGVGPSLFQQTNAGGFVKTNLQTGFTPLKTQYAQISDLTGDGIPEILIDGGQKIFQASAEQFVEITAQIFENTPIRGARDAITADFNNDLKPDLWHTRRRGRSQTHQVSPTELRSYWIAELGRQAVGTSWQSNGQVTFNFPFFDPASIFIGERHVQASSNTFSLDPDDSRLDISASAPANGNGIYINYDSVTQTWLVELIGTAAPVRTYGFIETVEAIPSWETLGFDNSSIELSNRLFINEGGRLIDKSELSGLTTQDAQISGRSAVAGDFDNDGDQDVYVLATGVAGNLANRLYNNDGNGIFTPIADAWGANGTSLGLGDVVTTVDINNDGFLDLMTANGAFFNGAGNVSRQYYNDAPYQIFVNSGNDNGWLIVDLQGTITNRDGIGSSVIVRAKLNPQNNASVTSQLRERNGGIHNRAQNDSRLHFGLGQAQTVDSLRINWLSGIKQIHYDLNINQQFNAIEGRGTTKKDSLTGRVIADSLIGLGGNDTLTGRGGADSLNGGSGRDLLVGSTGNDTLTGGGGRDRFRYRTWRQGTDTITDFVVNEDKIVAHGQEFLPALPIGTLPNSHFILDNPASSNHGQFLYQSNTGTLSFDPDGIGAQASRVLATLDGSPQLRASDITLT